jgi:hypothetical protein
MTLTKRGERVRAWAIVTVALVIFVAVCYVETVPN